jgi:hypothetical protein
MMGELKNTPVVTKCVKFSIGGKLNYNKINRRILIEIENIEFRQFFPSSAQLFGYV